jgi:hypothetical protein
MPASLKIYSWDNVVKLIIKNYFSIYRKRNSVVSVATKLRIGKPRKRVSIPGKSNRFFSPPDCPDLLWSSPRLLFNGYGGLYPPGVKRPGREADHSAPSNTEINNEWHCTSIPPSIVVMWCLIKHIDIFDRGNNILSNGYRGLFRRGKSDQSVKLTTHLHVMPMSHLIQLYLHSLLLLHADMPI